MLIHDTYRYMVGIKILKYLCPNFEIPWILRHFQFRTILLFTLFILLYNWLQQLYIPVFTYQ